MKLINLLTYSLMTSPILAEEIKNQGNPNIVTKIITEYETKFETSTVVLTVVEEENPTTVTFSGCIEPDYTSLNDILKTSGYIFEILNNNKKQSNLLTGPNNQLITPQIITQLSNQMVKFDDILDETITKFNDARWCVDQMVENKQRQEEMKIKEEMERARRLKEEQEEKERRIKQEQEEQARAAKAAAEAKAKAEAEAKAKAEAEAKATQEREAQAKKKKEDEAAAAATAAMEALAKEEAEEKKRREQEQQAAAQKLQQQNANNFNAFEDFTTDLDLNDVLGNNTDTNTDMLSLNYGDLGLDMPIDSNDNTRGGSGNLASPSGITSEVILDNNDEDNMDLDMNNLLGNDESILDGLNMSFIESGNEGATGANAQLPTDGDGEFDVDNFLSQFGAND
ncbi:hypothetical protein JA1_005019 [Spathaspora sp. JA1]|nr:hypothetical protein JA1_005019 [Spathaspora sp. JA1]